MSVDGLVSLAALEVGCDDGLLRHLARLEAEDHLVTRHVARTVRLHLALLQRRPDLLWPVLYAHSAFVDSPSGRRLGVASAGPDMPVLEQVHRWTAEWKALHPGTAWLRARTPPAIGSTCVAELRGLEAPRVVDVSDDAVLLETAAGWRRWSPSTAEVLHVAPPPPRSADFVSSGSGLMFRRDGPPVWLIPPAQQVTNLWRSLDGTRVTCLVRNDEGTAGCVFDGRTGEALSTVLLTEFGDGNDDDACFIVASGDVTAYSTGAGVTVQRPRGADELEVEAGACSSAAVAASGDCFASVEQGVVRFHRPQPGRHRPQRTTGPILFSAHGELALVGDVVLDADGEVRRLSGDAFGRWQQGPEPRSHRLTGQRFSWSTAFAIGSSAFLTGLEWELENSPSFTGFSWSGDGLLLARWRRGASQVNLLSRTGARTVETGAPLEAVALDQTGSVMALLLLDGTVQLQAGGVRLRTMVGATGLSFVASDQALLVGGRSGSVVIDLAGRERWRTMEPLGTLEALTRRAEWQSGLREPSLAEQLTLTERDGLSEWRLAERTASFPATGPWERSPGDGLVIGPDGFALVFEPG